jgi:predicted DNA-binding transcriptional regulator AlpA
MNERHLSIPDLAERERVSIETIYTWNSRGGGPRYLKIGRHVRYRLADVVAWEEARAHGGDTHPDERVPA